MNKGRLAGLVISFLLIIAAIVLVVIFATRVVVPFFDRLMSPENRDVVSYHTHHGISSARPHITFDGTLIREGTAPIIEDGETFLPVSFLRTFVDPFLFWDESAGVFFASTRREMLEFVPGQHTFTVNGSTRPLNTPIRMVDGEVFLPADLVTGLYSLSISYAPEFSMVIITTNDGYAEFAEVTAQTANVRFRPDVRAPIMETLPMGSRLLLTLPLAHPVSLCSITSNPAPEMWEVSEGFVRVRTENGLLGYIAVEDISTSFEILEARTPILGHFIDNMTHEPGNWTGGKINLVWEAAHNQTANQNRMEIPFHSSVTVVSPTWFEFNAETLGLTSVASQNYINWANQQGVIVWPKVFDVNNATARAILMNRTARQNVINQLVQAVDHYNLAGLNIDIEHLLSGAEGPYKIQFLRELSVAMADRDVVLSAAVLIPHISTTLYRRYLIGLTVDFVMLMSYDEHWSTSPTSGPVASMPWVNNAINNMLQEIPAEKLLLGLPFFNRVWTETALGEVINSRAWDMPFTRNFFEERGVEWEWDAEAGSYYGEITELQDGQTVIHRVWLEDERSIATKMQIFSTYDLAGVASWRRGFESPGVWNVIGRFF